MQASTGSGGAGMCALELVPVRQFTSRGRALWLPVRHVYVSQLPSVEGPAQNHMFLCFFFNHDFYYLDEVFMELSECALEQ
jgi:hypothetical protein